MKSRLGYQTLAGGILLASVMYAAVALFVAAQSASAHHGYAIREENQTTWNSQFRDNETRNGFPSGTRQHIRNAMYQWDDVTTDADFDIDESCSGYDTWVKERSFYAANLPDIPGTTRHWMNDDGEITYSVVSLNRDWDWTDDAANCEVDWDEYTADVRIVLTHEAGHLIALWHSSEDDAVMNADDTCKLQTVYDDDHIGVIDYYGED